jgi:copper chaperone CopZ
VKAALAGVDGVLGVEVDVAKAEVRVATAKGADGRALATDPINALGYQVLAN